MSKSLAVKYRPDNFEEVTEQSAIKAILQNQLETDELQHAYLFCGGAGTGKTTCARIFANAINKHQGNPIEMDAASNSGVDDVREIIKQSQTKSLDSEYKIFIIDECHSLSNTAWQAFLKLLEEPPAKSIFIFCTTDPNRIPKTILSRVQRYDFQRISHTGICRRLELIYQTEAVQNDWKCDYSYGDAIDYIAKLADGGMRDAITLLDKCIAYSKDLTIENVVKALGVADYSEMINLVDEIFMDSMGMIISIDKIYKSGRDLKQFMKQFTNFVLDVCKYNMTGDTSLTQIPSNYDKDIEALTKYDTIKLLRVLVKLNSEIKWSVYPRADIEAVLLTEVF